MRRAISFRGLIMLLYIGSLVPLLVLVGLVVYRLQQTYLLNDARSRLLDFVRADVEGLPPDADLTILAVNLNERLRVLGADLFMKDASGSPVPPALGTGPWMNDAQHLAVRESKQGTVTTLRSQASARLVYLTPLVEANGAVLGTIEASLPLDGIENQLAALRRWLTLIITIAAGLAVVLSFGVAGILLRPVQGLVNTADEVRRGDLQIRADLPAVIEINQLASTFNQMLDRLAGELHQQLALVNSMRRFAADASHELRSPLAVFRNSVDVLEKAMHQGDRVRIPEILAILRREVESMTLLVENLLLLARLEQASPDTTLLIHSEAVDTLPLLEEVFERGKLLTKGQEIRLAWPVQSLPPVLADRELLRRALNNIIENAIHHTPPGKQVILSAELDPRGCCFIVEDQGQGISAEQVPHIFDRFYRVDSARSRQAPGTGLGLAIVAAIVKAHGGEIQIASEVDRGTTMRVVMPAAPKMPE